MPVAVPKWVVGIGTTAAILAAAWVIHRSRRTRQSYDRALMVDAELTPAGGHDAEGNPIPAIRARVTNNGHRPISDVRMTLRRESDGEVLAIHRFAESIPAGSSDFFDLPADSALLGTPPRSSVSIAWSVSFRDAWERRWKRSSDRSLRSCNERSW
jgi:hypothetical protein